MWSIAREHSFREASFRLCLSFTMQVLRKIQPLYGLFKLWRWCIFAYCFLSFQLIVHSLCYFHHLFSAFTQIDAYTTWTDMPLARKSSFVFYSRLCLHSHVHLLFAFSQIVFTRRGSSTVLGYVYSLSNRFNISACLHCSRNIMWWQIFFRSIIYSTNLLLFWLTVHWILCR